MNEEIPNGNGTAKKMLLGNGVVEKNEISKLLEKVPSGNETLQEALAVHRLQKLIPRGNESNSTMNAMCFIPITIIINYNLL